MTTTLIIGNKNYSSWSLRAWLMLAESGLEFDEQRIAMDTTFFRQSVLKHSPAGRVPVLRIGDLTVWDSLAIAETLAECWPEKKLWPEEAAARAEARAVSAEMHSGFLALRAMMPMNCRAMDRRVAIPVELQADIDRIIEIWSQCQSRYDGDWLFGHFTVADAMFAPVVLRFRTYGVSVPADATRYPDRLLESEALQNWLSAAESETEVLDREEKGQ